jgi:DNA polymerase III subunit epsilon
MILVFDSETTGLPAFNLPAENPSQPHIVQLGAILYDQGRRVVSELNLLVRPDGWTIDPGAAAIHGITQEAAMKYGLKLERVIKLFIDLADRAELLVAHNYSFDERMIRRELHHMALPSLAEAMRARLNYCTMKASTPILNLPPTEKMVRAGFNKPKNPNLGEDYKHFTGLTLEGAHDAMADVRACAAVYFAMNPLPKSPAQLSTPQESLD